MTLIKMGTYQGTDILYDPDRDINSTSDNRSRCLKLLQATARGASPVFVRLLSDVSMRPRWSA